MRANLPPDLLARMLAYDPDTGSLTWLPRCPALVGWSEARCRAWNEAWAGKPAFTAKNHGYHRGSLLGRQYLAHRVAWALHHGEWPSLGIDHVNGNPSDNRICNLRPADQSENIQNAGIRSDNSSGCPGVHPRGGKWLATITIRGTSTHLGTFAAKGDAVAAYLAAKSTFHTFQPTPREMKIA